MVNILQNRKIILGYVFAVTAIAIWSSNLIIARVLNETIPPISLAFWRWFVAVIVFLPFTLKYLIIEWDIIKKHIFYLSITALLGVTTFNTLLYLASHTTSAINLSLISITFPIFIIILSRIFFRELITINKYIGIILVISGIVLLITRGTLSKLLNISFVIGDVWMLIGSIVFAFYCILLKRKPDKLSLMAFLLSTFILGLIFLFPFFVWEYVTVPLVEFNIKTICLIFYLGIFASISAFILWSKAILAIGPLKTAMTYYMLPFFSGILAYFFLKEDINLIHFYSMLFIISGIFTANYEFKKGQHHD